MAETSDLIPRLNDALAGRYEIDREIGEGGMATVYLAKDVKHMAGIHGGWHQPGVVTQRR